MAFPKIKMYISDKTSERCFPWLWFVRLVQMLVTIIVLAITASSASDFSSIGCSVPSKLGYNIAAAVLSFLVLLVLIFSTGPNPLFRMVPWLVWGQLALDIFMWIIWIAAAGVSQYNCSDLCSACADYDNVWAGGLFCYCSSYFFYKRDQSPAPRGLKSSIEERAYYRSTGPGSAKKNAKAAFDSIMVVLFAFTTAATIFWIFKNRKSGAAAASTSSPTDNTAQQPGGLAPTPAPGYQAPDGPSASLNQNPPQGTSFPPQQQPQPQMQQQSGYTESMQQSTYPPANSQGSAGEYYGQPQSQPQQTTYAPDRAEMPSPPPQQQGVSPVSGY
ncbi:MAG: hypothetical protein Q9169_003676 [Polycauliona sp. 2 TL-2023]